MHTAVMGYGLCILLALCMITLCHSQCMVDPTGHIVHRPHSHKIYAEHPRGCKKNGVFYHVGEEWKTEDCLTCMCNVDSVTCCVRYLKPSEYDKVQCEGILDLNTCTYKVVKKNDNSQACEVSAWVS